MRIMSTAVGSVQFEPAKGSTPWSSMRLSLSSSRRVISSSALYVGMPSSDRPLTARVDSPILPG